MLTILNDTVKMFKIRDKIKNRNKVGPTVVPLSYILSILGFGTSSGDQRVDNRLGY